MLSSALSKSNFPVRHVLEIVSSLRAMTESVHLYDQKVREQRALVVYATGKWSPRPDRAAWVRDLIRECKAAGLTVFSSNAWCGVACGSRSTSRPHPLACECP